MCYIRVRKLARIRKPVRSTRRRIHSGIINRHYSDDLNIKYLSRKFRVIIILTLSDYDVTNIAIVLLSDRTVYETCTAILKLLSRKK